jgi:hypothetical protein
MKKQILNIGLFVLFVVAYVMLLVCASLVARGNKVSPKVSPTLPTISLPSYWASCQSEQQRYSQELTENQTIVELRYQMHRMSTCLDETRAVRNGRTPSEQDKISDGQFMLEFYRATTEFDNRIFQQQQQHGGNSDGL